VMFLLATWSTMLAAAASASPPDSSLVIRIRLPDGGVRKVKIADPSAQTVGSLLQELDSGGGGGAAGAAAGLARSPVGPLEQASTRLAQLSLQNGDFLYALRDSAATAAAAQARAKRVAEARSAAAAATSRSAGDDWQPFPECARPPAPSGPSKNWRDLEAKAAQTYKIVPQKKGRITKLSMAKQCIKGFMEDVPTSNNMPHRCATLYGTVSAEDGIVRAEALYKADPAAAAVQGKRAPSSSSDGDGAAAGQAYDPTELLEEGDTAGVACAVAVARLLGLQPVGWCVTHNTREHLLSARDVATAAQLQLRSMRDPQLGRDKGAYFATAAFGFDPKTGSTETMAYGLSDLAVQMASDGVFKAPMEQAEPIGPRISTTEEVLDDKVTTATPETVGLVVNAAIVEHEGFLRSAFTHKSSQTVVRPKGGTLSASALHELRKCLFKGGTIPKSSSFLKRVSDFGLLVYIARELGVSDDFQELCRCVAAGDSSAPVVDKYRSSLWAVCSSSTEQDP
jgi:hypothetical protein